MTERNIYSSSFTCILCGEPLHPCIGCQEARYRRRNAEREETPLFCYEEPLPPQYLDEYDNVEEDDYVDYYDEHDRDDGYYESEMEGSRCFCCGQDHTYDDGICAVFMENPTYWKERMRVASRSSPYQGYQLSHPDYYYEFEGACAYETGEDRKLARLGSTLSKLDEILSSLNLSEQQRIRCLNSKCQALAIKIEIEERLAPLPDDIRDDSHMEEEVVEGNTTPMNPLSDEESLVDQMVCEDDEVEQSGEIKVCTEPLAILSIPITKCGEEGSRKKMRKAKLQDIGVHIMKWIRENRTCFLNMPLIMKNMWRWHVNYRAFIGNAVGKCALRPP